MVETLLGLVYTGIATKDSTAIISLSNSYQVYDGNDRNKGIRIYAENKQFSVLGLNHYTGSSDAFLALPCSGHRSNEYVYYGLTYYGYIGRESQFLFVACEDNNIINIGSITISLNKMQTYLFESTSDLTGTVAISNNPVSFFSGALCTFVPSTVRACDHLIEQLPDKSTWGTHFLSGSFAGRNSSEIYRILASQPSTTVTLTCSSLSKPLTFTLPSAGSWEEITTSDNSFCSIVSNNPVLIVQFALGFGADSSVNIGGYGDPFMITVPAINQYRNNYVVPLFHQISTNFITVFVSPEHYQPEDIYVDDVSLEGSNWTAIPCSGNTTCGYSAYATLAAGDHRIYHKTKSANIGVVAYGFDTGVSYGFPASFYSAGEQGRF